jgi:hypothetical protein
MEEGKRFYTTAEMIQKYHSGFSGGASVKLAEEK